MPSSNNQMFKIKTISGESLQSDDIVGIIRLSRGGGEVSHNTAAYCRRAGLLQLAALTLSLEASSSFVELGGSQGRGSWQEAAG